MTGDGCRFHPRPNPALTDPDRPGLRAHRHPPDRLHTWVFGQHQVWVDYWGNEHEIETISLDYAANVIAFCRRQAWRILVIAFLDALEHCITSAGSGEAAAQAVCELEALVEADADPVAWLEQTPLLRALRRRLAGPACGGGGRHRRRDREGDRG